VIHAVDRCDSRERKSSACSRRRNIRFYVLRQYFFPLFASRGYPATRRSFASQHNNGGLSDGCYHITWYPRDETTSRRPPPFFRLGFRVFSQLFAPIDRLAPANRRRCMPRPTYGECTWQGTIELAEQSCLVKETSPPVLMVGGWLIARLGDKQSRSKPR